MATTLCSNCNPSSAIHPRAASHPQVERIIRRRSKIRFGSRPVSSNYSSLWSGNPNLGGRFFGGGDAATGWRYIKDRPRISPIFINGDGESEEEDVQDILFRDGIITLKDYIDDEVCYHLMFTMLYMDSMPQPKERILLLIDCPGGDLQAGMTLYDTLCSLRTPLYTENVGCAVDMGAYILAAGMKGKRTSLATSTVRLKPLQDAYGGNADYILTRTMELKRVRDHLHAEFAKKTGQPVEKVYEDLKWDKVFDPLQALEYGIIDRIIDKRKYNSFKVDEEDEDA